MLSAILFAAAVAATPSAHSQPVANNSPASIADTFFTNLQTGGATKAYGVLWEGTVMSQKQFELGNIIAQTDNAFKVYGKVIDWEVTKENKISPNFEIATYMARTENLPVFFQFSFYRVGNRWTVSNLVFNDSYAKIPN